MCQSCVDNGRMTQADLDKALADVDGSDPEQDAMRQLDSVADKILDFLSQEAPDGPAKPSETVELSQELAGKLMFRIAPSSVAVALAVIALRYREILGAWADLYVDAHGEDADPERIDTIGETVGIPTDEMVASVDKVRERAETTQDLSDRLN